MCFKYAWWMAISLLSYRFVLYRLVNVEQFTYQSFSTVRSGFLACFWFIGWTLFAFNSPSEHPRITYTERLYLLRTVPKPKRVRLIEKLIETLIDLYVVQDTLVEDFDLSTIIWYCNSSYLHEFCFLHFVDIITNVFFDDTQIQFATGLSTYRHRSSSIDLCLFFFI